MSARPKAPDSPVSRPAAKNANVLAELVLQTCRAVDTSAHVSSILRDSEGRTIVRIRTDPRNETTRTLVALQTTWPLARSSVSENPLDGISEAEIIIPRKVDEMRRAWRRAGNSRPAEFLSLLSYVLLFMCVLAYFRDCKDAALGRNASVAGGGWSQRVADEL